MSSTRPLENADYLAIRCSLHHRRQGARRAPTGWVAPLGTSSQTCRLHPRLAWTRGDACARMPSYRPAARFNPPATGTTPAGDFCSLSQVSFKAPCVGGWRPRDEVKSTARLSRLAEGAKEPSSQYMGQIESFFCASGVLFGPNPKACRQSPTFGAGHCQMTMIVRK